MGFADPLIGVQLGTSWRSGVLGRVGGSAHAKPTTFRAARTAPHRHRTRSLEARLADALKGTYYIDLCRSAEVSRPPRPRPW